MVVELPENKVEVMETEESSAITPDPDAPPHPYAQQLSNFKPRPEQLARTGAKKAPLLESTPFTIVSTSDGLNGMLKKLREVKEIGISVHLHSYRTFREIVCNLGIATRIEDFLIDALALKKELTALNEIFTDESIMKVMYSAHHDLEHIQRELGLYMINLMDIAVADKTITNAKARQLNFPQALKCYCDVNLVEDTNHTNDWKVRPINEHMIKYARQKIHYLLSIQDKLQNVMVEKKCIEDVYGECTKICGNVWYPEKYFFKHDAYLPSYNRTKGRKFEGFNQQQLECFRLIFQWRWHTSEMKDESVSYTMPSKLMLQIAASMPPDVESLKKKCGETIPPLVEEHLEVIHKIVLKAIDNVPDAGDPVPLPKAITKRGSRGRADLRSAKYRSNLPVHDGKPAKRMKVWKQDQYTSGSTRGGAMGNGSFRGRGGNHPWGGMGMHRGPSFSVMRPGLSGMKGSGMGLHMGHGMGPRMGPRMGMHVRYPSSGPFHNLAMRKFGMGMDMNMGYNGNW